MTLHCSVLAYVLLTAALFRSPGLYEPVSLALVLAALAVALAGSCLRRPPAEPTTACRLVPLLLGCLVAGELLWLAGTPPSVYRDYPPRDPELVWFRMGVLALALLAASYGWRTMPQRRWRFPAVLVVYGLLGTWVITAASRRPEIDVWHLQQRACALVLQDRNPYAATYPNVYGDTRYVGAEMLQNGQVRSFPYPPLSLVLAVPGYLLGDVRWSLLLAIVGTAGFMVAAGRRLGLAAGDPWELAAVALLCHPRGLLVLEAAWTEPFLALALAAGAWTLAGRRRTLSIGALAAVLAVKQYGLLCLPPLAASGRLGWRRLAAAGILAALTAVPFVLWDPAAFWRGIVGFHVYSPFREDSLSVPAAVALTTGYRLPAALGFGAAGLVAALVWRRAAPSLATGMVGVAAVLLAFFAFNKAAHLNYYWLAGVVLAVATLLAAGEAVGEPQA